MITIFLRSELGNPLNMIQNGYRFIFGHIFLYEKYELGFEEGEGVIDQQLLDEDLFNHIVLTHRIWRPWSVLCDDFINIFGLSTK